MTRREWLGKLLTLMAAGLAPTARAAEGPRVAVVGGGIGGVTAARHLKHLNPGLRVGLIEPRARYSCCFFSNEVLAGLRDLESLTFDYGALEREGIQRIQGRVADIDAAAHRLRLESGATLAWDLLVLAPGIAFRWGEIEGYDAAAAERMPHAWQAGKQTLLLRRQLESMPDGGLVVIAPPREPYRCPPAPYERASLIAGYLRRSKPRAKVLILDAKDGFPARELFEEVWEQRYPGMIEWLPASGDGRLERVDAATGTLHTEFSRHRPAVANIIPGQRAGELARDTGLTDADGWCPIDQRTFESRLAPDVYVIGDACRAGHMGKSGFATYTQAIVCAAGITARLRGAPWPDPVLLNGCYTMLAPDWAISSTMVYHHRDGEIEATPGAGGRSATGLPAAERREEAERARQWLESFTRQIFG